MKHRVLPALLAIAVFTCCSSVQRYSSVEPSGVDNTLADIDLFGFRLSATQPAGGSKTLWDLSADAQSQYIKILNTRYPDNDKFLRAMSLEYLSEGSPGTSDDFIKKDLRMIFSISKRRDYVRKISMSPVILSAADRIEYVKISLRIPDDSGIRFTGWNRFTTEYGTIDIADLTFSRSLDINAAGVLASSGKDPAAELSGSSGSSLSRKEDQKLKYRYIMLNGRISNTGLEMEEEGTREIDLTGNISADISLEFDSKDEMVTEIDGLKDSTGKYYPPEKLSLLLSGISVPVRDINNDTLFAELTMNYIFRNVIRGEKTFQEWDDHIRYYRGKVTKRIILLTPDDYIPDFCSLGTVSNPDSKEIIRLISPSNQVHDMIFRNSTAAGNFFEWLEQYLKHAENRDKTVSINGYKLTLGDQDLTAGLYLSHPGLRVLPYYR